MRPKNVCRKKAIITLFLGLFLAATPHMASAFDHHGGLNEIHPVDALRLLFSDAQNKQLDEVLGKYEPEMRPYYGQLRADRQELEGMFKSESAGDKEIKAQINKISEVEYQLALKHAALTRAIRKIATPEQLAKVDRLEAEQMKAREEFFDAMSKQRRGSKE